MTLVIPMITLISIAWGKPNIFIPIKHATPRINEAKSCPETNPENTVLLFCVSLKSFSETRLGKTALISFLLCAKRFP